GTGNPSPTIGTVMGWFKYQTTQYINTNNNIGLTKVWQRSYHDHIIRNENDYLKIWQYIDTNALKWQDDCYYQ
ncbi:MAG: transposase, partial [Hyphomonadaceae bacterium]|nr:transposase [Clostridia bacterium]